jgi:hypothetical protein
MTTLGIIVLIMLVLYYEWQLFVAALAPLLDILVALFFMVMLVVLIVVELSLIVIAPVALFLGYESREWHIRAARKIMFARKQNA